MLCYFYYKPLMSLDGKDSHPVLISFWEWEEQVEAAGDDQQWETIILRVLLKKKKKEE